MNWNYLLFVIPLSIIGIMFAVMLDWRKRDFPTKTSRQLCGILIAFPPLLGPIFYYFLVIKKNRFPKKQIPLLTVCPHCNSNALGSKKIGNEWLGFIILIVGAISAFIIKAVYLFYFVMPLVIWALYLMLKTGTLYWCNNCKRKWRYFYYPYSSERWGR